MYPISRLISGLLAAFQAYQEIQCGDLLVVIVSSVRRVGAGDEGLAAIRRDREGSNLVVVVGDPV